MARMRLGLDLGSSAWKLAVVTGDRVERTVVIPAPELPEDAKEQADEAIVRSLKGILQRKKITARECALSLPPEVSFLRRITMPYMTAEQLKINLPYEFHDYIQEEKDAFFYDYAVIDTKRDENGKPTELELLAAAGRKDAVERYRTILKKAGLRLQVAIPEYLAARNLLRDYERRTAEHPKEYCIVDMGHKSIRMHIYRGTVYDTTRVIEFGGASLETLRNKNTIAPEAMMQDLYTRIAVEIMRAINFYGFNTPDSDLQDLYFTGGLSGIEPLMKEIHSTLELNLHDGTELLPTGASGMEARMCAIAVGVTMQGKGR